MRWVVFIFFLILCNLGDAQPTTLTILGRTNYTTQPQSYIYKISNTGLWHSGAEFDSLKIKLDKLGVIFRMDSTQTSSNKDAFLGSINFYTYTLPHFEIVKALVSQMGMSGEEHYEYAHNDFVYQDALASLAYQDALKRAKIMAQSLGKEITGIRNIDDHVDQYLFYLDLIPNIRCNPDELEKLISLFEILSRFDFSDQQSERSGQYALWVTFEVK